MDELVGRNLDQTGQHYMIDKKLIEFMVDAADLQKDDVILEVGPGKGALTGKLAAKNTVIAVDIEPIDFTHKNVVFIHGNILHLFDTLYKKHQFTKIVSNIPYNLSEPLFKKYLKKPLRAIVLTTGKAFSDVLRDETTRIGILANRIYVVEILKTVPAKAFFPQPRVQSAVVRFIPKNNHVARYYQQIVSLDDKKIKNILEVVFTNKTKKEIKRLLEHTPFANEYLYSLTNQQFVEFDVLLQQLMK